MALLPLLPLLPRVRLLVPSSAPGRREAKGCCLDS
jgi:hypothetical protein